MVAAREAARASAEAHARAVAAACETKPATDRLGNPLHDVELGGTEALSSGRNNRGHAVIC